MKKIVALRIMYLVIAILFLQVAKVLISRIQQDYSFFAASVIIAIQFLLLIIVPLFYLFRLFFQKKNPARAGLFSWLSVIAVMVLLELVFTYWYYHPSRIPGSLKYSYRYYYIHYANDVAQFDDSLFTYNKQLTYTMKPYVSGCFQSAEFKHTVKANSMGLRDDEESLHQPDIICLGDSFTWGWGDELPETFPEILEKLTGKKILNAAIPSYGTARSVMSLSNFDLSKLEYLLVQYCGNDVGENYEFVARDYKLKITPEEEYRKLCRVHRFNSRYFPGKNFLLIAPIFLKQQVNKIVPVFSFEEMYGESEVIKEDAMVLFLDILAKAPIDFTKVKIIAFQLDHSSLSTGRFARLVDSLRRTPRYDSIFHHNLEVVDFQRTPEPGLYFDLDMHLTPLGQERVAHKLAEKLKEGKTSGF